MATRHAQVGEFSSSQRCLRNVLSPSPPQQQITPNESKRSVFRGSMTQEIRSFDSRSESSSSESFRRTPSFAERNSFYASWAATLRRGLFRGVIVQARYRIRPSPLR